MIKFSNISTRSILGRVLRAPLRVIPEGARVRIMQGPGRGLRWIVGSSSNGVWLGSYEPETQKLVAQLVKPGMCVFDVGANVGFYTILFARLAGQHGRVVAFEPFARNAEFLHRHVMLNAMSNVDILQAAVADTAGEIRFASSRHHEMGRIDAAGELVVQSVRLDDFIWTMTDRCIPDLLKLDVEGAEASVLRGARRLMQERRPLLLIATHGAQALADCLELLDSRHYDVWIVNEVGDELLAVPKGFPASPRWRRASKE